MCMPKSLEGEALGHTCQDSYERNLCANHGLCHIPRQHILKQRPAWQDMLPMDNQGWCR